MATQPMIAPPQATARVLALGDGAATVVFGDLIAPEVHARVKAFCAALNGAAIEGVEEWAPAFASATVWYDPDRIAFDDLAERLGALAASPAIAGTGELFELAFCAEGDLAPDLAEVARLRGMTADAWLDKFSSLVFEVYMLGFQPGFAYLGGLPDALSPPRLATPRKSVPAGSVAVADGMCAAYPFASPGGWRLIGRTRAVLFDIADARRPTLLKPGDRVRWRAVARTEFDAP
ncbi:MAG TPA: 5-oxoprolinase subunit PxpB, partial [Rhodoblastus sp.]|nr:5-oxoprolinase subunit PxpB [Rhodoblastus sp.]